MPRDRIQSASDWLELIEKAEQGIVSDGPSRAPVEQTAIAPMAKTAGRRRSEHGLSCRGGPGACLRGRARLRLDAADLFLTAVDPPPFDLVIFDCDGVLIDSEIISARMLIEELARLGVVIDLDHVARHFLGRSYPTVMAQIREEFHLDLPADFEDRYRDRLLDAFGRDLKIMPGVLDVLDELAVPFCVATSSSPRRVEMSLFVTGLAGRTGAGVFTASQVARGKPRRTCSCSPPPRWAMPAPHAGDRRQPDRRSRRACGRDDRLALRRWQPLSPDVGRA
jgi:hypothetical protein